MTSISNLFRIAACAVMVLTLATSAHATYIGLSWVVPGTDAPWLGGTLAPNPILFPTTGLDATFTSTTVNFMNGPGSGTLRNFITSDAGATIGTCTTTTVGAVTYNCNTDVISTGTEGTQTATTYGQIIELMGTETFVGGTTYSITHDDGIVVTLDGAVVINSGVPTALPTTNTFTTTSGTHAIVIEYAECCGNPSILTSNLPVNTTVPEPANFALVVGGLLTGVGLLFRRKFNGKGRKLLA
jgi:hypothetical protein